MNGKMGRFLQDRLAHPFLPLHLAIIALLLTLPALWVGWQLDDHFQRLALSGTAGAGLDPNEIFSTLKGDLAENRKLMVGEGGVRSHETAAPRKDDGPRAGPRRHGSLEKLPSVRARTGAICPRGRHLEPRPMSASAAHGSASK